ncbi:MAG: integrase core domain-containing protein [Chthoniobacteraceae bacterium]
MPSARQHPLLVFLVHVTQSILLRKIAFLQAENQILRSRLPNQIRTTVVERSLLVRLGAPLGDAIVELLSVVHYKTFLRWKNAEGANKGGDDKKARPPGRPSVPCCVEELILRFAGENAWGYSRIRGELRKLGIIVARNTIKKIMIKNGFHPSPNRTRGDWERFLKRHMETLWATDFFTKDVWTGFGKVTYYVLFFIHVGSRRVRVAGMTCQPNGPWVEQQARNLVYELAERGEKATHLIKDGDTKFTAKFDEIFKGEGIKVKKLPFASPNLNAHAERFVQSIKRECLNQFVVFGERHLEYLVREYEDYYNTVRPHQGLENRPIGVLSMPSPGSGPPDPAEVGCDSRLGGLLRHYYRKAA